MAGNAVALGWPPFRTDLIPVAESALADMVKLRTLVDARDAPAVDQLVAHEEAPVYFAKALVAGEADPDTPLNRCLERHGTGLANDAARGKDGL